jgi:hypothetical protein
VIRNFLALLAACFLFAGCATYSSGSHSTITDPKTGLVTSKEQHRNVSVPVDSAKELIGGATDGVAGFLSGPLGQYALGALALAIPGTGGVVAAVGAASKRRALAAERERQEQHRLALDSAFYEGRSTMAGAGPGVSPLPGSPDRNAP